MKAFLLICCIALFGADVPSYGKGLSDLEEFARSPQNVAKVFTDVATKQKYRRALETYAGKAVPLRDFEATWEKLRRLYTDLDGVKGRLAPVRQPLSFEYKPEKDSYRFERVNHPMHAAWLLQNLREPNTDSCTQRDNLLADRWTPMLTDASLFAVEKNGAYTGTTLTLVPVQSGTISYLLVVPSDSGVKLPEHLLEAFLRDYRKKDPEALRFALLTKDPRTKLEYRIEKVDDQGRRASRLGAVDGFRLLDPMAKKLLTFAPSDCGGGKMAKSDISIDPIGSALGEGSGAGDTNISFNANAQANSNPIVNGGGNAGGSGGLRSPMSGLGGSGGVSGFQRPQGDNPNSGINPSVGSNTNITNNNDNRVVAGAKNKVEPPEFAVNNRGSVQQQQQQQPQQPWQPQLPRFTPQEQKNEPEQRSASNPGLPMGGGGIRAPSGGFAGGVALSPKDQKFRNSLDEGRRALKEGRSIPKEVLRDVFRGTEAAENPDLRNEMLKDAPAMYFQNKPPLASYDTLRETQTPDSQLVRKLKNELCENCPRCPYCREIKRRLGVQEGAILR